MPPRLGQYGGNCLLAILGILVIGAWQLWQFQQSDRHLQFEPVVRTLGDSLPGSQMCADCHQSTCEQVSTSPHGTTLSSGDDPRIRERFSGKSFQMAINGPVVTFRDRDDQLWMESDAAPEPLRVDWVFGSGRHAQTPVSLLANANGATELIEGSVSWYPPGVLGFTPGASGAGAIGMRCLGTHQDYRTTQECFGCHVTRLPVERERIQTEAMLCGVSCDRCHLGGAQHVRAMQQGHPDQMERWSDLTPLESVNRCGECHRRADQLTNEELLPERTVLVRFASVGLAMSRCFLQQTEMPAIAKSRRLDCLTCHDPHRPAEQSVDFYVAKCSACHGPGASQGAECSSPHTMANCLTCHMPRVRVADKLVLTDHWIRIRKSSDPPTVDGPSIQ